MTVPLQPSVANGEWLWQNEPCRAACPVHTDAGGYVTAIAEGRFRDAYLIARRPNPFPSVCGRICAAPCETACRRGKIDAPIAIRALKRFVTERFGVESFSASTVWHEGHGPVPPASGPSVAVVGGGPAGLAAAHDLRLAGHGVTIYEAQDRLGGMMILGIPEYRLPRSLIAREIEGVLELGVEARTGCQIGVDISLSTLLTKHQAVFLATGTGRGRDLDIPGRELDGVLLAVEFLLNVNKGFRADLGGRVVVVGGGNVAFDAARTTLRAHARGETTAPAYLGPAAREDARRGMTTTLDAARAARRAGVLDVTVVALESPDEIPAAPEEIAEAEAEGIKVVYRRGPNRFVGSGRITGLETIAVSSVFDEAGRFAPAFVAATEEVIPADTVILAVGQSADLGYVEAPLELARTARGDLVVDRATLRTSHPKIWAGGDVAFGPRNLIDAIAEGRRAAASIHHGLEGPAASDHQMELSSLPRFRRLSTGYDAIGRVPVPAVASNRRIGFGEVELGYDDKQAWLESLRCLRCFDNVMLQPDLCILCGLCVDVCPHNCISIVRADKAGLGPASASVLLLDEEVCIRCGLCVNRCPPGALLMVTAQDSALEPAE